MNFIRPTLVRVAVIMCLCAIGSVSLANAAKDRLFDGAYQAYAAAQEAEAEFLGPNAFADGVEALTDAEKAYSKDKPVEKVRALLVESISAFNSSQTATKKARIELANGLAARKAALGMKANKFSPKDWEDAEDLLAKAIDALEDDKKSKAKSAQEKAVEIYRAIELVAIKAEYLTETRRLIAEADKAKVAKQAPATLRKAKELLATAEVELTENRYDVDLPRSLAKDARYEVNHAFYLSEKIKNNKKDDLSDEQVLLESEVPLQQIAAAADINARFDKGSAPVADSVIQYIEKKNEEIQETKQLLSDKDIQIAGLKELLEEFATLHGGVGSSVADLEAFLLDQEQLLRRVEQLETMFDRTEARVFRDSREIYIRLIGLSFESGSSHVTANNYYLLDKVVDALRLYPEGKVIVEGHTDSFGGDDSNLILSRNRAESVRYYLINRNAMPPSKIEAIGFGEIKPFANNDTPQGRALNRRIDIRILPKAL